MTAWLVVDLGGVAAAFRPDARLAALAQACDLPPAEIHRRLFASGLDYAAELGHVAPDDIVTKIIGALDERLTANQLIDAWATAFVPDSELLTWIGSLDVRRCLFTNNGPMINHCFEGPLREVASSFDRVICSWQMGRRKPDRASFEFVERTLDASPASLLLIDDDHDNVHAAAGLGWRTHQHTDSASTMAYVRAIVC